MQTQGYFVDDKVRLKLTWITMICAVIVYGF